MLSDVLIPMLDLSDTADPIEEYLAALQLLEGVAGDVDVVIPGHGFTGGSDQVRARIDQDRAYVQALRDDQDVSDPRIGPSARKGWEWVSDVHAGQLHQLARTRERDGTPGTHGQLGRWGVRMDDGLPRAEAVAVRNGRILAVGDDEDVLALRRRPTRPLVPRVRAAPRVQPAPPAGRHQAVPRPRLGHHVPLGAGPQVLATVVGGRVEHCAGAAPC
jgi:hypothetical protein